MKLSFVGASYGGNKGAASMLVAAVEQVRAVLPEDTEFFVFSMFSSDVHEADKRGVSVVHVPLWQLLSVFPFLSVLLKLCRGSGLFRRILLRYEPLRVLYESNAVLDLSGISFVDGRELTLLYNIDCIWPFILHSIPVYKMSQALGPFHHYINRSVARILLPGMAHIFARGEGTATNLNELGLSNHSQAADLAFLMSDSKPVSVSLNDTSKPVVCVMPSQVLYSYCNRIGIEYVEVLIRALNAVSKRSGIVPLIMAHSTRGSGSRSRLNDVWVCNQVYDGLSSAGKQLITEDLSPEELRYLIGRCDVAVSSRFHGMISALCQSVPVLVTSWSHKYHEVMKEFDSSHWVIDKENFAEDVLTERLTELFRRRTEIRDVISRALPSVVASSRRQIDFVADRLVE